MRSRYLVLATCAMFVMASCAKKEAGADNATNMKADSMKAAYTAMTTAWDAGKSDEFGKYVAADMKENDPMPGGKTGLAGMQEMAQMMKTAFPDMKSTIEDMRVDGDVLTVRFKVSGTNTGPMHGGMPATNKKMDGVQGIEMMRWQNGKFVEHWGVFDAMKMMEQLGMMPPMPGSGAPPAGDMKPMDKDMKMKMGDDKKKM